MRTRMLDHDLVFTWLAPVVLAGLLSACGGGADGGGGGSETAAGGAGAGAPPPPAAGDTAPTARPPADTGAAPNADTAAKPAGGGGGGGDAKLIALGDSIFHGQAGGGTCHVCHGQDAKGSAVGPNLTDKEWLNNDGTLAGITGTINSGVPKPKSAPAPMPPMGGASLNPDQVKAVATYVHSLGGGK